MQIAVNCDRGYFNFYLHFNLELNSTGNKSLHNNLGLHWMKMKVKTIEQYTHAHSQLSQSLTGSMTQQIQRRATSKGTQVARDRSGMPSYIATTQRKKLRWQTVLVVMYPFEAPGVKGQQNKRTDIP